MRTPLRLAPVALSLLVAFSTIGTAWGDPPVVRVPGGRRVTVEASLQNGTLLQGADGQTYLGIWVAAPELRVAGPRPPMALSLVIDRSGSMAGDKIVNARMAAQSFLSRLRDGDVLSVYAYDDEVMQVFGPAVLEPASREIASSRIAQLQPGGSTNIYGGLSAAQAALQLAPASHPVRRTILISDGMANVGPSTPAELGMLAARGTDLGINVTTIGVGLQYDESTMQSIAMRSAGRFYHLQESGQLASILEQELQFMSRTVATGAILEIVPAPGIVILGAEGVEVQREGERVLLPLGSLYSEQRRQVLVRVRADTSAAGPRTLGQVRVRFRDGDGQREQASEVAVPYRVSGAQREVAASVDGRVATMVQTFGAARAQQAASTALNRGDSGAAAGLLVQQAQAMRSAAAPMAAPARAEVERRAHRLEEQADRARRSVAPAASRGAALDLADESFSTTAE